MDGCIIRKKNSAGVVKRYRKLTPADVETKRIAQVVHRTLSQFVEERILDKIVVTKLNEIATTKTVSDVQFEIIKVVEDALPSGSQQSAVQSDKAVIDVPRPSRRSNRKTSPTIRDDVDFEMTPSAPRFEDPLEEAVADAEVSEDVVDDSLRYIFTNGARLNARLLYTLDEKCLYRCKGTDGDVERYICIDRNCGVGLNVSKTTGVARKSGKRAEHNHGNRESKFQRDRFMDALKRECIESNGAEDIHALFLKHQAADPVGGGLVKFEDVKSSLMKNSRKNLPKKPKPKYDDDDDDGSSLLDLQISQLAESGAADGCNTIPIGKDDPLQYVFTPSSRLNSQLLYTIDEKNLYRRKARGDETDRYICTNPDRKCLVSLSICHATGVAKKCGPQYRHRHPHRESQFRKNRFMHALKKACIQSGEKLKTLYAKHLAEDPVGGEHVTYETVKSSLSKTRISKLSKSVTTMDEFEQESIWD